MGMTNAERQRKFRLNRDGNPERRQQYIEYEKRRYRRNKETGKKKSFKDMTDREKRHARKKWRTEKRIYRKKLKEDLTLTPPMSPAQPNEEPSRQRQQSQRKRKKEAAKCYRDNDKLKTQLENAKQKVDMYRKRWQRARESDPTEPDTPRTKTRKFLRCFSQKTARRTLLFHNALINQQKQSYKEKAKMKEKQQIVRILSGSILRKFKFKSVALNICGATDTNKRRQNTCLSKRLYKTVREFYEREDVSRLMPGSKRTVTFRKVKKQRRILKDTILNIHLKFKAETGSNMSYTTFCRLRPFWVVFPTDSDRNTCLCKTCENAQFMTQALFECCSIKHKNVDGLVEDLACSTTSKECMYSTCMKCSTKRIPYDKKKMNDTIEWQHWKIKSEKRTLKICKKLETKEVSFTVKETEIGHVADLTDRLNMDMERYKRHRFNIRTQFEFFREKKFNLKENECLVHVDFSENYVCKMRDEVHSMHFGASKKQLTLHTGIYYCQGEKPQTFCTVSENLNHGPGAIWAHLRPVLQQIKDRNQRIDSLHFFSDGPTAQYRQKANFHLLSLEPRKLGFTTVSWNFFESGHGKGVPDAVGGTIKRSSDQKVKYAHDITSAKTFVDLNKDLNIYVKLIPFDAVTQKVTELDTMSLKTIKGTLRLHQVIVQGKGLISHRDISCTCISPNECKGHTLTQALVCDNAARNATKEEHLSNSMTMRKQLVDRNRSNDKSKKRKEGSNMILDESIDEYFENHLKELKKCRSIKQLQNKCKHISESMPELNANSTSVNIVTHHLEVDMDAMDVYPDDVPDERTLYPCKVHSNGNCLPSCASVFAYGCVGKTSEMRVRILVELVLNEQYYLTNENLQKGDGESCRKNLPKLYAQYSDMFIPGMHLSQKIIQDIYRLEVLKVRCDKSFMGIWQLHALASVLKSPLYSVYPALEETFLS